MKRTTVIAILLALVVGVSALASPTMERPAPVEGKRPAPVEDKGEGIYLVVLGDRGTEPDIAAMGGRLLRSWADRRLVAIPRDAVAALRQHERVRYVQRVWMGENTDAQPIEAQPLAAAVRAEAAPPPWSTGTFTYDPSGNIQSVGDDTYGYDAAGRLTQASVHGQSQSQTQSYAFDAYGNLLGLGDQSFTVSAATNRLMATQIGGTTRGFTYDDAGRLEIDADGRRYQYDGLGMATLIDLPAAEAIDGDMRMIYTADDERIAVAGARTTTYRVRDFGARVLREWESTEGILEWQRDYIYAGGALVAGEVQIDQRQNGLRHYHTDHLGSIRMVTNGAGELVSRHDYMPFGAEIPPTTTEFDNTQKAPRDPRKFTGHERDYFTGSNVDGDALDYMHARYYAPEWGRFLSVDPVLDQEKALKEPQRWNRYSYVINNPLRYRDPDGRQMKPTCEVDNCPAPPKIETVLRLTPENMERTAKANANKPPTMSSANGAPPTPGLVTVTAGLNVNFVALGGGSAGVSVMHANRIGTQHAAVAATGAVHTPSPRGSAGIQATFGLFRGGVTDQRGAFTEANFTIMTVGVSLAFTKAGGLVGGTISYGPSVGAGYSTSESGTVVLTGQEALEKVGIDP